MTQIYIPAPGAVPAEPEIWRWYMNIEQELSALDLTAPESECIRQYYVEAGLLTRGRRRFFRRHYARSVRDVAAFLFEGRRQPLILDLGCGVGTQTLLFASLGASVVAMDMDGHALEILRKRQLLYERRSGRLLSIRCSHVNSLLFDYSAAGPFDGVFSMFAFNMMQPSAALVDRILQGCADNVRIGVVDGNNRSWLARFVPSRRRNVWSPWELAAALRQRRFSIAIHRGAVSVPPAIWNLAPRDVLDALDNRMNGNWFMPVSHLLMAERRPSLSP